jgi:hypothetical protein
MNDPKDYITKAEQYASESVPESQVWDELRNAFLKGYLTRWDEEKEGIAKLHERIKELETKLLETI